MDIITLGTRLASQGSGFNIIFAPFIYKRKYEGLGILSKIVNIIIRNIDMATKNFQLSNNQITTIMIYLSTNR